jgi:tetratricopeptide (TPR) repeat protein
VVAGVVFKLSTCQIGRCVTRMSREEAVQRNQEGLRLFQLGKNDEAIRLFDEAIEIDADYAAPWLNRSEVNRKLGRETEADADKEKWRIKKQSIQQERDFISIETILPRLGQVIREYDQQHMVISPLFGDRITIDKPTQSIVVKGAILWLIPTKRVIPFSDAKVVLLYKHYHPVDSSSRFTIVRSETAIDEWEVFLDTGRKKTIFFKSKDKEFANILANAVSMFIGKELEHSSDIRERDGSYQKSFDKSNLPRDWKL